MNIYAIMENLYNNDITFDTQADMNNLIINQQIIRNLKLNLTKTNLFECKFSPNALPTNYNLRYSVDLFDSGKSINPVAGIDINISRIHDNQVFKVNTVYLNENKIMRCMVEHCKIKFNVNSENTLKINFNPLNQLFLININDNMLCFIVMYIVVRFENDSHIRFVISNSETELVTLYHNIIN